MRALTAAKADAVAAVVRSLADAHLRTLKLALPSASSDAAVETVRRAVEAEAFDRRLRDSVLRDVIAAASPAPGRQALVPLSCIALLWRALCAQDAEAVRACARFLRDQETDAFEAAAAQLIASAALGLAGRAPAFEGLCAEHAAADADRERLMRVLQLAPIARDCTPRARRWLKHGGVEDAAALRLAMRDASAVCADGGPLLLDLVAAHFSQPHCGLRLVSAVMDRPSESVLAGSELAGFATTLVAAAEAALDTLRRTARVTCREEGAALAATVSAAVEILEEIEHAVQLDRARPWGRRVAGLRKLLAAAVEVRLKQADGAVETALPVHAPRPALKQVRGAPRLEAPLDAAAVGRAEGAICFVEGLRRAAATGGFGGLRARVIEALDARLDTYVEDLLERLHGEAGDTRDDLIDRLNVAAELLGMVRDPSAAQIVRRRMAAAA